MGKTSWKIQRTDTRIRYVKCNENIFRHDPSPSVLPQNHSTPTCARPVLFFTVLIWNGGCHTAILHGFVWRHYFYPGQAIVNGSMGAKKSRIPVSHGIICMNSSSYSSYCPIAYIYIYIYIYLALVKLMSPYCRAGHGKQWHSERNLLSALLHFWSFMRSPT